jgi:hypothetical protein
LFLYREFLNAKIENALVFKSCEQLIQTTFVLRVFKILSSFAASFAPKFGKIAKTHDILLKFTVLSKTTRES